jgi:hypothetical protein
METQDHYEEELELETPAGLWSVLVEFAATHEWELVDHNPHCDCSSSRCAHTDLAAELVDTTIAEDVVVLEARLAPRLPDGSISDETVGVAAAACDPLLPALTGLALEYAQDNPGKAPGERDFRDAAFDPPW